MSELIVPPRHRANHERGLAHYLRTGEGPVLDRHIEIDALHRAGHEVPVELSITRTAQFGEPVFLGFLRDISERRDAARRQELMIGELNHRVKNLLGVVAGVAHLTARNSGDVPSFIEAFGGRLSSLGRAHEILTAATWEHASLRQLIDAQLDVYLGLGEPQVVVVGQDVLLAPRDLLSLSMITHELLTNAVKYGALAQPHGRIRVEWSQSGRSLSFAWIETGLIDVKVPTRQGFGSRMIGRAVGHELRGRSTTEWQDDGMAFRLEFELDQGS